MYWDGYFITAIQIFLNQDASESPVVLAVSAVGCPIRRRMSVTILPVEPYSTMAMVLNSDGRPGYRTATILDVVGWSVEGNVLNVYPGCSNYPCGFNSMVHSCHSFLCTVPGSAHILTFGEQKVVRRFFSGLPKRTFLSHVIPISYSSHCNSNNFGSPTT